MTKVYTFPPISALGTGWTVEDKISRSKSLVTSKRFVSSYQRTRLKAVVEVSGVGVNQVGAGYNEVLKRLLKGGENLVRLKSYRINTSGAPSYSAISDDLVWTDNGNDLDWTHGTDQMRWFSGVPVDATPTTSRGLNAISLSGLPPDTVIIQPGQFIQLITDDGSKQTLSAVDTAKTDGSGIAIVMVVETPIGAGRAKVNVSDEAVFEADEMPSALTPVQGDWIYRWNFTQVFEDETDGFEELDPWN